MVKILGAPGSYALLNGDEAVARGAIEAGVKVASSYPGTPATEILETIAEVAKERGIYAEWSVNEIVAVEVATGAAMTGVRAIVSMKHVGMNVASDAVMTLAYTGVEGGLVIAVCDDPALHSSQNEQDTRYFAVHSKLPLFDAGNPQEALEMTKYAFELSETVKLPVIVRLTTRVAHGKAKVQLTEFNRVTRVPDFDKKGQRWVMVPSNAILQHGILEERLVQTREISEKSRFNSIEDNHSEIGIIGSGAGYYYARSILEHKKFSWLKLGLVHPFPSALVEKFASKVKKIIVIEELRPYLEENIQRLKLNVSGKDVLGLQEIGEYTPDKVRAALAKLGLTEAPLDVEPLSLPPRPPNLCPGCPHRAFYYALNMINQHIQCENEKCTGCGVCEYSCSMKKTNVFNAYASRIRTLRINQVNNTVLVCRLCQNAPCVSACPRKALMQASDGVVTVNEDLCKGCDWCMQACEYGSLYWDAKKNKAFVCDHCGGDPECIKACPEQALTLTGSSQDKIVTGDIGCYTLGVLPPITTLHSCLCMGAGISQAAGMFHAGVKEKIFAVIGDSTFFHGGLPGLVNIAYNKANVCVIILDNNIVAMTGHQPTPASGKTAMGTDAKIVRIKDVAKGLGIEKVDIVNPLDVKGTIDALRDAMHYKGPSVIISERPCPLLMPKGNVRHVTEKCRSCRVCVRDFGCPAISLTNTGAEIDPTLCRGCGVCQKLCPFEAIEETAPC